MARCDELAAFTEEPGRITRPFATPSLAHARQAVAEWMRAAGMDVRIDAIGNLRGRFEGTDPVSPALLLGSHLDSVRDAGKYDGPLGILVAIAAIERLATDERRLPFPVEVVAFPDEEGLRFQTTYLGSAALAGTFDPALLDLVDADGISMREALSAAGDDPDAIATAALQPGEAFAYVEVHIEQGPRLEAVAAPLGVVTAISGQTRILATFYGEAGHAGTVPMDLRRDPLPAAAELILAAESLARRTAGLLATVGKIEAIPGASNVIPGRVELSLDIRHPEDEQRQAAVDALARQARRIAGGRSLDHDWRIMRDHPAVQCDATLTGKLASAVEAMGNPVVRLPSGAGHDAVVISSRLPVAMLFVRCAGGISHNPAESVTVEDVAAAIAAIDHFLDRLADAPATSMPGQPISHPASQPRPFDLLVRGGSVVTGDGVQIADIAIEDGRIVEVAPAIAGDAREEIDARGLHVLPGAVDIHVHFNDPGRAGWEGWETGSLACAVGGTTTVADMPLNARPPTLDGPAFDAKRAAAEGRSAVDFALWGGLTPINLDRMAELAKRGVVGFKAFMSSSGIDDFPRADDATLRDGMARAAALGLPVAVHAEDETITTTLAAEARASGRRSFADYAASRPPRAELEAIGRAIRYAEEAGCALHVVHVSTAAGLSEIAAARARGVDVTAETCPHYLLFCDDDATALGPLAKCAPPLRSAAERQRLLQAVAGGDVDLIASDHSPSPPEMKAGDDFFQIWGGIAGCQSLMLAMLDARSDGMMMPLARLAALLATTPAQRLRLPRKGRLAPGYDADLALVDLDTPYTLEPGHLRYRHAVSPYAHRAFPASVRRVVLRGETVALDHEPVGPPCGRLLTPVARDAT